MKTIYKGPNNYHLFFSFSHCSLDRVLATLPAFVGLHSPLVGTGIWTRMKLGGAGRGWDKMQGLWDHQWRWGRGWPHTRGFRNKKCSGDGSRARGGMGRVRGNGGRVGMIGMGVGTPRAAEGTVMAVKRCLWAASLVRTAGGGVGAAQVARLLVFACPAVLCGTC